MQPRIVKVGPLAASGATKIAASQTAAAAGYLALNGTLATAGNASNNICASQSGTASTALLLNGATSQTQYTPPWTGFTTSKIAVYNVSGGQNPEFGNRNFASSPIYITSAGNDSGVTWTVVGTGPNLAGALGVLTETFTGTNTSICASANSYKTIISITPSGNTASTVTVGWMGFAKLDTPRQVLITDGASDTGITFTFTGTDWAGNPITEVITGGAVTCVTTLSYATVTSIKASGATASTVTVGTNGVAYSPWINFDTWSGGTVAAQIVVSGTANYTIQVSNDDPNSVGNPVNYQSMTWDSNYAGVVSSSTSNVFQLSQVPQWARILLNSNTNPGSVTMTAIQQSAVSY